MSDTLERMLRPQGLFQSPQPSAFDWDKPYSPPPAPSPYLAAPTSVQPPAPPTGWSPAGAPPPGYPQPGYPEPGYPEPGPAAGDRFPYAGALSGPWGNGPQPTNGQYPAGQQQNNGQYPGGQYPSGQYPGGQAGPGQFPPGGPGQFEPGPRPRRLPRGPLIPVAAAGAVVVVVVAAILLSSQHGPSSKTANPGAGAGTPTASASSSSTGGPSAIAVQERRAAATKLATFLPQSGGDIAAVNAAVGNVSGCGKDLSKDVRVFRQSAANRRALLTQLRQLAGRQALPAGMVTDLTHAWQYSITVDEDLSRWAADQVGHCRKGNTKDHNYQLTLPYDTKSTAAKQAFVELWNPLAHKEGLSTYTSGQL